MIAPIAAADVPPEWIEIVRKIRERDKAELRATGLGIECRTHLQNRWHRLMLFSSAWDFVTEADRDLVLKEILK